MKEVSFADLGLSPEVLAIIKQKGFTSPSPIQAGVIPLLLNGKKDIIGQAQTGTGKTAAFAIPLLEKIDGNSHQTEAIILTPTRELAIQVAKEIESFSVQKSTTVTVIYGGNNMRAETTALKSKPSIIVGTPGRIQHHIRKKNLPLDTIKYFVLDEADEMLNFGFREEIEEILKLTPPNRRVLLFSATMPKSIMNIVTNYMKSYDTVKVEHSEASSKNIKQKYYCVAPKDKFEALSQIMESEETFYAIVFCRTKIDTDLVASKMIAKHLRAEAIHGDIDQSKREKILSRFREGKTNILVATDVAARGIDITDLNFVVNYTLPENHEIYTHRIGRTGRAGNQGTAISLVSNSELHKLRSFEKRLNSKIEKAILPTPQEIIAKKEKHLIERLEHIVNNEEIKHLLPIAEKLLEEGKASEVIAALIKDSFREDFNLAKHPVIEDDEKSFSAGGRRTVGASKPSFHRQHDRRKFGGYQKKSFSSSYKKSGRGR